MINRMKGIVCFMVVKLYRDLAVIYITKIVWLVRRVTKSLWYKYTKKFKFKYVLVTLAQHA